MNALHSRHPKTAQRKKNNEEHRRTKHFNHINHINHGLILVNMIITSEPKIVEINDAILNINHINHINPCCDSQRLLGFVEQNVLSEEMSPCRLAMSSAHGAGLRELDELKNRDHAAWHLQLETKEVWCFVSFAWFSFLSWFYTTYHS